MKKLPAISLAQGLALAATASVITIRPKPVTIDMDWTMMKSEFYSAQ